jgi:hypothetical protein
MSTQILVSEYGHTGANPRLLLCVAWILTVIDAVVLSFAFPLLYEGYGLLLGGLLIVALGLADYFSLLKMWAIACVRVKATELQPQRRARAA